MRRLSERMDRGTVRLVCVYAAEAVICLLAVVMILGTGAGSAADAGNTTGTGSMVDTWSLMAFPYAQIGAVLRYLSLSGGVGNVLAWILYIMISLIPAGIWLMQGRRRLMGKTEEKADGCTVEKADGLGKAAGFGKKGWFLPVFSLLLFVLLYLAVNPAFLFRLTGTSAAQTTSSVLLASCALLMDSLLVLYLVVRLLQSWKTMEHRSLMRNLRYFFYLFGFVMVLLIFGKGPVDFMSALQNVQAGNTGDVGGATCFLLILKTLAAYLPEAVQLILSVLAVCLLKAMEEDIYGEKTVHSAALLARFCSISLAAVLGFQVCLNGLNLLFLSESRDSAFAVGIPLGYIGFSLILILFAGNLSSGRELKQDYDLFI